MRPEGLCWSRFQRFPKVISRSFPLNVEAFSNKFDPTTFIPLVEGFQQVFRGQREIGFFECAGVGETGKNRLVLTSDLERLAIDEHVRAAIQHARLAMQYQTTFLGALEKASKGDFLAAWLEENAGFGLRQMLAQEDGDVVVGEADLVEFVADARDHVRLQFGRVGAGLEVRIGIAAGQVDGIHHEFQEGFAQFLVSRCAEAHRIGHALTHGHAVVRVMRRQIEHVAGFQDEFFFRLEMAQDLQWHAFFQRQVFLGADAPAALAMGLQQEYVVGIEVRTDTAAVGGVADHQVIQARIGYEAELAQQGIGRGVMQDVSDKLLAQFVACLEQRSAESVDMPAESAEKPAEPAEAAAPSVATAPVRTQPPPDDALDLGATVLPVLLKSYGKQVAAGLGALVLVIFLWRRRGRRP